MKNKLPSYFILFSYILYQFGFILASYQNYRELESVISLKPGLKISNYFKNFTEDVKFHEDKRTIMKVDNDDYKYTYDVYENSISVLLPSRVGSTLETLEIFIDEVNKDNTKLLIEKDYAYNISYPQELVTTYPKPIIYYPNKTKNLNYDLEFNLNQPQMKMNLNYMNIQELYNVTNIDYIVFGRTKKGSLKGYYYNNIFSEINMKDLIQEDTSRKGFDIYNKNITDIVVDSNIDTKKRYILFTDSESTFYIFQVIINQELNEIKLQPLVISFDNRLNDHPIIDFVFKNEYFFIAYKESGLSVFKNYTEVQYINEFASKQVTGNDDETMFVSLQVLDLQEVGNAIYVLSKDFGLKILDVTDPEMPNWTYFELYHPYLVKIDIHLNPYYSHYFLSVLVNNRGFLDGHEFFFELSLKNEFYPNMYRYFLSDKYLDIKYVVSDDKYTYLFEHNSNYVYIIARSITATSNNSIYKIHWGGIFNQEVRSAPFIFKDKSMLYTHLGIFADDQIAYSKIVKLDRASINLNFEKDGNYNLTLYSFTDYCGLSTSEVQSCIVKIYYNFNVLIGQGPYFSNLYMILFFGVVIIIVLVLVFIVFNWKRVIDYCRIIRNIRNRYIHPEEENYDRTNVKTTEMDSKPENTA